MEINRAFGFYLILEDQIRGLEKENESLKKELKDFARKAGAYAATQIADAPRVAEIFERMKESETTINHRKELQAVAKKEIVNMLKMIHPILSFPYKEAGQDRYIHFELNGEDIRVS